MPEAIRKFVLVIPTLNESDNVRPVLDRARSALSTIPCEWEILVVDDDSSDGTADIVSEYAKSEPRVRVLVRRGERGLAGAITRGWANSSADLLGVMDADLQHPPEVIPALISEICKGSDIAIASRYVRPHSMDGWNPVRRIISQLGVRVSKLVQRPALTVKDPLSGFFLVRRKCIEGVNFQQAGFKLLLEILARGRIDSVSEVPFNFAVRQYGSSKAGLMTAAHYVTLLYNLRRSRTQPHEDPRT